MRLRGVERSIAVVRLLAAPFVLFQVAVSETASSVRWVWPLTALLAVGAIVLYVLSRSRLAEARPAVFSAGAQLFDSVIIVAYVLALSEERGSPVPEALYLPLVAACFRFQIVGGLVTAAAFAPVLGYYEDLRSDRFGGDYRWDFVTLQAGFQVLVALVVGMLVRNMAALNVRAASRALEAEAVRDRLGRRVDLLDAAGRCARALGSSLDLDEAFGAFIRELGSLVPFDRVSIVLVEDGEARTMAVAGRGAGTVFPPGARVPIEGTLLEEALRQTRPVVRRSLDPEAFAEEAELAKLGLACRLAAPLVAGPRTVGVLSLTRASDEGFAAAEVELVGVLGPLLAGAVQNIRAYEAERDRAEELRRLSALRADFVSLVSHEVRTPLAAVLGAARTLQSRFDELSPEQRDAFVGLIAVESERLAGIVEDVLDTSRIDAGTFSYRFAEVDVGALVDEAVAAARAGHQVEIVTRVAPGLPRVRGDHGRLRQVLTNLIDNAVKHSPTDEPIEVCAAPLDGGVAVEVTDRGAGIAPEDQQAIFEKFGRAPESAGRPGAGLGLYIARAIAEAHSGGLDVSSVPGQGATFTLRLPAG